MENTVVIAVSIAIFSGIAMWLLVRGQKTKTDRILEMLKSRGPMTLDEIAQATRTNLVMKGYLMQALDGIASKGGLTKLPPPKGHPVLRIARDTKYALPSAG